MNDDIVGEVNSEDFKYFVANEYLVAGVLEEDEEKAEFVIVKSHGYPVGTQGALMKETLDQEVEKGLSVLLYSYEEALAFDIEGHSKNIKGQ